MTVRVTVAAFATLVALGSLSAAQEKPVPKDSTRVTVAGCAKGRAFVVRMREEPEPSQAVAEGRRFRLEGPKKILEEIKKHEANMVQVTGIVRSSQLSAGGGVPVTRGGGVRVGGGPINQDPTKSDPMRDPMYNVTVMDVESWQPLPDSCSK
jgi:hypothetical protein